MDATKDLGKSSPIQNNKKPVLYISISVQLQYS